MRAQARQTIVPRTVRTATIAALLLASACVGGLAQEQEAAAGPPPGLLVLSPSVFGGATCTQGWPLVLELALWREQPAEAGAAALEPLTLTAKQGSWCEALVVSVTDDAGAATQWPLHLVASPGGQLALSGDCATATWWLAPEETKALKEGDYTITVAFDAQKVDGLPTGAAAPRSDPYHVRVAREPAQLDADMAASKLYRFAWYCIVKGDQSGAQEAITKLLAADPQSIGARRLQAMQAAREGRTEDGLKLVSEAIAIYLTKHPHACPPVGLLSLQDKLAEQLAK